MQRCELIAGTSKARSGCTLQQSCVLLHQGVFRFICIQFGLNTSEQFANALYEILLLLIESFHAFICMILSYSLGPIKLPYRVKQGLQLLNNTRVALNLKKCEFLMNRIDYVDHIIKAFLLDFRAQTIVRACSLQQLCNITELSIFPDQGNVLRQFISSFARNAESLNHSNRRPSHAFSRNFLNRSSTRSLPYKRSPALLWSWAYHDWEAPIYWIPTIPTDMLDLYSSSSNPIDTKTHWLLVTTANRRQLTV